MSTMASQPTGNSKNPDLLLGVIQEPSTKAKKRQRKRKMRHTCNDVVTASGDQQADSLSQAVANISIHGDTRTAQEKKKRDKKREAERRRVERLIRGILEDYELTPDSLDTTKQKQRVRGHATFYCFECSHTWSTYQAWILFSLRDCRIIRKWRQKCELCVGDNGNLPRPSKRDLEEMVIFAVDRYINQTTKGYTRPEPVEARKREGPPHKCHLCEMCGYTSKGHRCCMGGYVTENPDDVERHS